MNNNNSFTTLYEKLWLKVYVTAYKSLADSKIANELTHEAFFHLWIRKDQIDMENALGILLIALRYEIFKFNSKPCVYIDEFPGEFFTNMPRYCAN